MKRSGAAKFPNSVQLFKFCQKVLFVKQGGKVNDQDVGSILDFNPSDCSHWKRGEKNVKSVFALAKLAETLDVETTLIHDITSGSVGLDEAFYEYQVSKTFETTLAQAMTDSTAEEIKTIRDRTEAFVAELQKQSDFTQAPLYLPEVLRLFSFISTQPTDLMDRLTRVLRIKSGHYSLQYQKGDLKPQTRMSIAKDLARIIFEGERERFPELGDAKPHLVQYEEMIFTASLLAPKAMMLEEMSKLDSRKNVISELATLFWVPKSLIGFQMQDILRSGERPVLNTNNMQVPAEIIATKSSANF